MLGEPFTVPETLKIAKYLASTVGYVNVVEILFALDGITADWPLP